ncbi:MAG: hypothetical protein FJZ01_28150, partial [Candidatus Sericytochromatia bacterium]|nr:hypothetical protein [Candidatus Tanganyikabacteria bacterium]
MRKQWGRLLGAMLGLILVIGAGLEAHSQGGAPAPKLGDTKSAAKADQPKAGSASRNPAGSEPSGAAREQTKSENSAGAVSQASQPESHVATPTVQSNPSWWELRQDLPLWLRILFYLWLALVCIFVLWGLWVVGSWIWSIERRFTELSAGLLKANNELKNLGDIAVQAQESAGQAGHGASNALS